MDLMLKNFIRSEIIKKQPYRLLDLLKGLSLGGTLKSNGHHQIITKKIQMHLYFHSQDK